MTTQEEIQTAIQAHAMWKINILKIIESGSSSLTPEQVRDDHQCAFGQWLYGHEAPPEITDGARCQRCFDLHARFHILTSEIMEMALQGKRKEAIDAMTEPSPYCTLSDALIDHLKHCAVTVEKKNTGKA
ncbi:MAG: CZB domain-containing protein [Bdellovibrionales bacterium]|jgi:methyl-accepting chemotaxis protein